MFQLVYCSTAVRLFRSEELDSLLAQSRKRNAEREISGLLVYHDGGFIQVLEGLESNVRGVFASILRDPRHHSVVTVLQQPITEREFAAWHMAFRHVRDAKDLPDGFSDFLNPNWRDDAFTSHPGLCHDLMLAFRKSIR